MTPSEPSVEASEADRLRASLMNARWEAVQKTDAVAGLDARGLHILRSEVRAEVAWYVSAILDAGYVAPDDLLERYAMYVRDCGWTSPADHERAVRQAREEGAAEALRGLTQRAHDEVVDAQSGAALFAEADDGRGLRYEQQREEIWRDVLAALDAIARTAQPEDAES